MLETQVNVVSNCDEYENENGAQGDGGVAIDVGDAVVHDRGFDLADTCGDGRRQWGCVMMLVLEFCGIDCVSMGCHRGQRRVTSVYACESMSIMQGTGFF